MENQKKITLRDFVYDALKWNSEVPFGPKKIKTDLRYFRRLMNNKNSKAALKPKVQ